MAQLVARLTCPNCRQTFAAPVEQVLDVEVDPTAKTRLLSGQVNLVVCPACGFASTLDIPSFTTTGKRNWPWSLCRCPQAGSIWSGSRLSVRSPAR